MRAAALGFAERTSPAAMRWGIYVFIFVTAAAVIIAVAVWQMLA